MCSENDRHRHFFVVLLWLQPQFTIDQLFFNTRYVVRIQLPNEPLPSGELARVVMETPRCQSPSEDFRHCDFQTDVTTPLANNVSAESGLDVTEPRKGL